MVHNPARPVSRTALWFFRTIGPVLLLSGAIDQFVVDATAGGYDVLAGPLYLVAWVGSFLVFLDHRRTHPRFAVPFALIVLVIVLLAVASLAPVLPGGLPAQTRFYVGQAARILHLLAALALTVIGWTTPLPPRR